MLFPTDELIALYISMGANWFYMLFPTDELIALYISMGANLPKTESSLCKLWLHNNLQYSCSSVLRQHVHKIPEKMMAHYWTDLRFYSVTTCFVLPVALSQSICKKTCPEIYGAFRRSAYICTNSWKSLTAASGSRALGKALVIKNGTFCKV